MGGMDRDRWMAESPEAKTPNGRVCPMAGRQKRMPYGHGQRKGQKMTEKNKALNHPSSDERERERER